MQQERKNYGGAPAPAAPAPATSPTPTRFSDQSSAPSPLSSVADFSGSNSSLGNPRAYSVSAPMFGSRPDIPADQLAGISKRLSGLVYSVAAGGYLNASEARDANSWYNKFGNGSGGDPTANRAAQDVFSEIGNYPTVANETPALGRLRATTPGLAAPSQGPSLNSTIAGIPADERRAAGVGDVWQGPWAFGHRTPGFSPYGVYRG